MGFKTFIQAEKVTAIIFICIIFFMFTILIMFLILGSYWSRYSKSCGMTKVEKSLLLSIPSGSALDSAPCLALDGLHKSRRTMQQSRPAWDKDQLSGRAH